ncbi:MAG: ABC transporter permease [Spirochaetaceae bacterium]|jgi:ribose/xylose/arabinose/galactoside ABC-type transport system permease subunit|nr:ABC transporter permease [Spirochaetaceae bacterium]
MKVLQNFKEKKIFWPSVIFLIIILFNIIVTQGDFVKLTIVDGHFYGRMIDIIRNGSKLMLLSIGMTMVIASGGIDISVGSVMAISGAIACSIISGDILPFLGGNVAAAIILALLAGALLGRWNGFLVSKINIQPMVATLILLTAGRGIAQLVTGGKIITVTSDAFYYINGGYILGLPVPVYIVAVVLIIALLFTSRTAFGLFLASSGINDKSSRLAGINVARIKLMVYIFCSITAAGAGLIESSGIRGADSNNAGMFIELDAILAVAIGGNLLSGGRFSIGASIIGALIIQSITTTIYAIGVPAEVIQLVKALLVISICLIQSEEFKNQFYSLRFKRFKRKVVMES